MPQIGWLEILAIVIIAILVLGPKEFPIALKKIGSYFGKLKTYLYLLIERFLASTSSAIIAISNLQKDELVNNFKICSSKKMHVIPLGFDLERFQVDRYENRNSFRTEFALEDDCIAIGIVGRLTAIKNQELFLRSVNSSSLTEFFNILSN